MANRQFKKTTLFRNDQIVERVNVINVGVLIQLRQLMPMINLKQ